MSISSRPVKFKDTTDEHERTHNDAVGDVLLRCVNLAADRIPRVNRAGARCVPRAAQLFLDDALTTTAYSEQVSLGGQLEQCHERGAREQHDAALQYLRIPSCTQSKETFKYNIIGIRVRTARALAM